MGQISCLDLALIKALKWLRMQTSYLVKVCCVDGCLFGSQWIISYSSCQQSNWQLHGPKVC